MIIKVNTEKKQQLDRAVFKESRQLAVASIKVAVADGREFDGDEQSQQRMTRAIIGLQEEPAGTKIIWVLANNEITEVTKEVLQEALKLAGLEQTKLWIQGE